MSRREQAKTERRRRIIAAARELVRETGDTGLSMRAIAARAGVSLATPYNLFGSKRAIVVAILEDVRELQERFNQLPKCDPVERIFQSLAIAIGFYVQDPEFYRTLWSGVLDTSGKEELRSAILNQESQGFWAGLVEDARKAGALRPEISADVLVRNLIFTQEAVMLNWVFGEVATEQLEDLVAYGYALSLRGATTEAYAKVLDAQIVRRQEALAQSWPKPQAR